MKYLSRFILGCALCAGATTAIATEIVVIGHPSAAPLTKEQVADIFLGKNQAFAPIDLPEAAAIRTDFYRKATGRDLAQVKAVWSRLVFSGKGQPPKELADASVVKKAVAADPKSIAYIEKGAVDASVKVLTTLE